MKNKEFNGWTNYQTWRINLELGITDNKNLAHWDEEQIEEWVTEYIDDESTGLANDLARTFLRAVNWHELCAHLRNTFGICRNCHEETENEYCADCEEELNVLPFTEKG